MVYQIKVNRESECCGIWQDSSGNWKILDKKAHVIRFRVFNIGKNLDAANACPKKAITIVQV
jgi:Fe-S oxidoreductase